MEKLKLKIAAVYARVSGDRQKKEETIESQLNAIQEYAQINNYYIEKNWIFKDEAESGNCLDRPALDCLRDLVKEGGPDIIIIHEPDRLARKNAYQVLLLEEFERAGVPVEFVKYKKPETAEEQLTLNMLGAIAEFEREKIADRCRRGRLYKAKMGKISVLPNAPYGFIRDKEDGSYNIDPIKSNVVKEIFFLYVQNQYTLQAIAKHLEAKGILAPRNGKRWDHATLRDILKNETYIGTAYYGRTERTTGTSNRILRFKSKKILKSKYARKERPKDTWIPIPLKGFIGENDFQIAQELLVKNKKHSARNTKEVSLLQGLLICKECGNPYYKKVRKKTSYYCCSSKLKKELVNCGNRNLMQEEVDSTVWNEILFLLRNPTLIEDEIARRVEDNKKGIIKNLKRNKIEKELSQLSKAKDKLLDAYSMSDFITTEELKKKLEIIKKRTMELENDLKTLGKLEAEFENTVDIKATLEQFQRRLSDSSTDLSKAEKQKIVRLLIDEIEVGKEAIKIKHCIPVTKKSDQKSPLSCVRLLTAQRD